MDTNINKYNIIKNIKYKKILSLSIFLLVFVFNFFLFKFVLVANAYPSPKCETNLMKDGVYCKWDTDNEVYKSWCTNNTNTCDFELLDSSPTNPENGAYAFSCKVNDWVLGCYDNYSECKTDKTCVPTLPCDLGYSFDACNNVCTGSTPILKLAYDSAVGTYLKNSTAPVLTIPSSGNVGIGTTDPSKLLNVAGQSIFDNYAFGLTPSASSTYAFTTVEYVNNMLGTTTAATSGYLPLQGGTMSGDIDMGAASILNTDNLSVNKLTAVTIDPLYLINGINYSTYAPSISGGVKEEYVGRININQAVFVKGSIEYQAVIDFSKELTGSDLWVWRQVVDFSRNNVEVCLTPYGQFAQTYYIIEGNKLILRSNKPAEISYRLVGKRFDWRKWPTKALDQSVSGYKVFNFN